MTRPSPAEGLLKYLGVTAARDIDIDAIAYHVGAFIKYRPLDGCEARIVGVDDRAVITVNSGAIPTRRRFSAAHELGHWHHHRGRSFVCRPEDIGNPAKGPLDPERVADGYAADLLMPPYLFTPMANQIGKTTFQAVEDLRKEFNTSITAAAIRLVEYGAEPAMLVCHAENGRRWFCRPRHIPDKWFPRDNLDADSYAMDVLHGDLERSRRVLIGADAWFDRWDAQEYEVYEETCRTIENEILTLLVFKDEEMLEAS